MEWKFDISPVAASRPRVGKWGAYYSGPYKEFREEATEKVYKAIGTDRKLLTGPLAITLELYVKRPKKTAREHPRADLDNYAKAVFDILNGKLWEDDSQIVSMYVTKEWAEVGSNGYFILGVNNPK
jgi:Holliday junction resolvase RusA-like endonuclease